MQLYMLGQDTGYIQDETNIGFYIFPDKSCLLIDSGAGGNKAQEYLDLLQEQGLALRAILNSHAHADHCGGNAYLQEQTNCAIYASSLEAFYIQNPFMAPLTLFSAHPPLVLANRYLMPEKSCVSQVVSAGEWHYEGVCFYLIALPGHSLDQLGLLTPDGVAFIGDSLMTDTMVKQFGFVYAVNIEQMLASFQTLLQLKKDTQIIVPGHGEPFRDLSSKIQINQSLVEEITAFILEQLEEGLSRETLLERTIRHFQLPFNSSQYYLIMSTLSAFLSFLMDERMVRSRASNGQILYQRIAKTGFKIFPPVLPND